MPKGNGSLFDRLDSNVRPLSRTLGRERTAERIGAIKRHLERLLNARQGCALSNPDYGLPDFNDAVSGTTDLLTCLAAGVRVAIAQYEPRVDVRQVRLMPDADSPVELYFRVDCTMPVDHKEQLVEIDLVMNRDDTRYRVL
ncbi:type VI secretion system baseplate subunit TssE [Lysobacter arvi]|uniref:Type VI secretion system baseplate subunit TssE n=1 Tax=Lysobacter arvi TaxID=3038776 RepID=A0ABU1CES6_9GAMM|nr:type VI secretion system baseplate subunit TssE [Lysobacter arvi]MDR0183474.1 type VI secretion system baseplate subunit TssE [Lysobacter arvi]